MITIFPPVICFSSTRQFWSTNDPASRVAYKCYITRHVPEISPTQCTSAGEMSIPHDPTHPDFDLELHAKYSNMTLPEDDSSTSIQLSPLAGTTKWINVSSLPPNSQLDLDTLYSEGAVINASMQLANGVTQNTLPANRAMPRNNVARQKKTWKRIRQPHSQVAASPSSVPVVSINLVKDAEALNTAAAGGKAAIAEGESTKNYLIYPSIFPILSAVLPDLIK